MTLSPRVPDLAALDVMVSVARLGSMSAAGRELGLSQQAVSARVRAAERDVGLRVFERTSSGVALTPEGVAVLEWAQNVLVAAEKFATGVRSLLREERANLTVAASMTVAEHLVPGWIVRMRTSHPDVHILMRLMNSAEVAQQVLDGRADIGFIEGPDIPSGLGVRVVATDELVVVTGPEHEWARRASVEVDELARTALSKQTCGTDASSGSTSTACPCAADFVPSGTNRSHYVVRDATSSTSPSHTADSGVLRANRRGRNLPRRHRPTAPVFRPHWQGHTSAFPIARAERSRSLPC